MTKTTTTRPARRRAFSLVELPFDRLRAVRQSERTAFSLIELLVVIGIITLLIGLLMPVLARAKQAAYRVGCLSNLRQLGIALQSYREDEDGALPIVPTLPVAPFHRNPDSFL